MLKPDQVTITLADLAHKLDVRFLGDGELEINGVASFSTAKSTDLCFLQSSSYLKSLFESDCAAVIVPEDFCEEVAGKSFLYSKNPHLAFVRAIHLLKSEPSVKTVSVIHPSAQIAESALLGQNISIAANCVIGERVRLADGVTIAAGCIVEQDCEIGQNTQLHPRVTICHNVSIGEQVILQPGVVIGSDGFGLVPDNESWIKIPHLGRVQIGNRVEIGANTTVDRGALDDTIIEDGVKLDNLIQVAHNVRIGENTAIAACVGIAGSASIGKNCKISGGVGVLGHLSIADDVTITAMSLVTKSILKSGVYSSGTPLLENRLWHRNNARYKKLDKMARNFAKIEKK